MRAWSHYIFAALVLAIYGGQVCPFIDSLPGWVWLIEVLVCVATAKALRLALLGPLVRRRPSQEQAGRQFRLDLGLFLGVGLTITVFDMSAYSFPAGSGLKVVLACAALGFFAAADLALLRERQLAREFLAHRQEIMLTGQGFPLTRKFALAAMATTLTMAGIFFLLMGRDLEWLTKLGEDDLMAALGVILLEVAFVAAVFLLQTLNLIRSYSLNLRLFFGQENQALMEASRGNLTSFVPVSTADEFGVMASYTNQMIGNLRSRTEELALTQEVTILTLASLAETRDNETGGHIQRTQHYVRALAERLASHPDFAAQLDPDTIRLLYQSAPLHDIGKVGVPDAILLKPGRLTPEEFTIMKLHTVHGRDSLQAAEDRLGASSFLRLAHEIAYTHHEMFSGKGYPQGLAGEEIPLSGRLMALADVYDAFISKRVYKEAFSHDKAKGIILEGRGSHFDPRVVDAFLELEEPIKKIARRFADGHDPHPQAMA